VGFLACVGLAEFHTLPAAEVRTLIVIGAAGMFAQCFDVIDLLFQASGEARVSAWVRMSACVIGAVLKVVLILAGAEVWWFIVVGVTELALSAAGWWWMARRRDWRISAWRGERSRAGWLLRESSPLALAGIAIYAQAYADQLVIGAMLGATELGQYSVAMRLISVFAFVPMVIQTVAAPEITRAKRDDEALYQYRLHTLYRVMFGMFVAVAVPLILFGPLTVRWLFGTSYSGAAALLPWLAFRLFFTNFGVARSVFITADGLLRFALLTAVVGAGLNIGLNLILVPRWGAGGAIASSMVSFAVTTFGLEVFNPRARANLKLMASAVLFPWRGVTT
jgi:O-antigen/teichoic acid export membrane protein